MSSEAAEGPIAAYQKAVTAGIVADDTAQRRALASLQRIYTEILEPAPTSGWLHRWFGNSESPRAIQGLYMWGGVGRGKTYLMDLFYDSLPEGICLRLHFHRFMRKVHHDLRDLQGAKNPLEQVAANFAREARVLCFDEFFVSDITDAMLLAGLLDGLVKRGVTLVATSNVEPEHLYENGLQRRKFLPAIALLEAHNEILNVDGGVDYRLRVLELAEIFHSPLDEAADQGLERSFHSLSPDLGDEQIDLEIEGRQIRARKAGDGVVWFDFAAVCEGPRSQNDYIELARLYQSVLISGVPVFSSRLEDQARRFISLVDEFYDRNVKLILSAEAPIESLYQGSRLAFEFQRTASRLWEMQSHDYLAREHLP